MKRSEGVLHGLAGMAVLLDELDRAAKELELHQRGLAALPRHRDLRHAVRLEQLADVGLERGLGHTVLVVRVQRFLRQEEAVGAIDVAGRSARLGQQMEARGRFAGGSGDITAGLAAADKWSVEYGMRDRIGRCGSGYSTQQHGEEGNADR
jgi:hypothetical protein